MSQSSELNFSSITSLMMSTHSSLGRASLRSMIFCTSLGVQNFGTRTVGGMSERSFWRFLGLGSTRGVHGETNTSVGNGVKCDPECDKNGGFLWHKYNEGMITVIIPSEHTHPHDYWEVVMKLVKKIFIPLSLVLLALGFLTNVGMYLELEGQIARIHELQHDRHQRNDRMAKAMESIILQNASTLITRIQEEPSYSDVPNLPDEKSEREWMIEAVRLQAHATIDSLSVDYQEAPYFGEKL